MMKNHWLSFLLPALLACSLPTLASAQISINVSVNTPPPELPVYEQPPIPEDGYIWTPGFWSWSDDDQDYYWVPGTWVPAPEPEYLWTPGYWGFESGFYLWHGGYWGPHVGFYGGVNYGYGYGGNGYEGGYWQGGHMYYNRSVTNVNNVHITNVYNKTVINNVTVNRVSFNGGNGGVRATPTAAQEAAAREHHIEATSQQRAQVRTASATPSLRASANQGHPPIAATARPGAFSGAGVVAAKRGGTLSVMPAQHEQPGAPQRNPSPFHNEDSQRENPARNEGQFRGNPNSPREAPVQRAAPPQREAPPPRETPVQHEAPPQREAPVQREAPPPRAAAPPLPQAPHPPQAHPAEHPEEHEHH